MTAWGLPLIAGVTALVVSLLLGYRRLARMQALLPPDGAEPEPPVSSALAATPWLGGLAAGCALLALFGTTLANGDRFFEPGAARVIVVSVALSALVLILADYVRAFTAILRAAKGPVDGRDQRIVEATTRRTLGGMVFILCVEVLVAFWVVSEGVRFGVLSVLPNYTVELGAWAIPLTVLWLVATTNIAKALDGLDGAVNVLLLVASFAIFWTTLGTNEFVLRALSVVVFGATLGSLRFYVYPARFRLGGGGSAAFGFVFAVLTVLARQKTVAALLFVLPLGLLAVLIGAAMLGALERTMFVGRDDEP